MSIWSAVYHVFLSFVVKVNRQEINPFQILDSPCAFPFLPPLYLFISPLCSLYPPLFFPLEGGCSHQYLWLCYTQHLLEGRAINGIQGRAAEGQQPGECGSVPGFLQSIPHYWLSISSRATQPFSLNLTELEWTWNLIKWGRRQENDWSLVKNQEWGFVTVLCQRSKTFPVNMIRLQSSDIKFHHQLSENSSLLCSLCSIDFITA